MVFFKKNRLYKYVTGTIVIMIITGLLFYPFLGKEKQQDISNASNEEVQKVNSLMDKKIVKITHYLVGQDLIETDDENVASLEEVKEKYPSWELTKVTDDKVILEYTINDMSPDLKGGSYFGIGSDGFLTLYRGNKDNKENQEVIQTFFRIDIERLETGLPKEPVDQLYKGIPIQDLAEFNSVLSTFSEFSIE